MIPTTAGISEPDTSFGTSPLGVGVLILRNVERGWRSEQASTSTTPWTTFGRPRSSWRSFSGSSAAFWVVYGYARRRETGHIPANPHAMVRTQCWIYLTSLMMAKGVHLGSPSVLPSCFLSSCSIGTGFSRDWCFGYSV